MTTADNAVRERREGTQKVLAKLQAERTEMLVLFCRLAGLELYPEVDAKKADVKSVQRLLQQFCQILVDYIATAHFGVYERIAGGQERRRVAAELAAQLYPRVARATEVALEFNDKYDCEDHCDNLDQLQQDLSALGEVLAERIELEDRLIQAISH